MPTWKNIDYWFVFRTLSTLYTNFAGKRRVKPHQSLADRRMLCQIYNKQTLGKIMHIRINRCLTKLSLSEGKLPLDFIWPILIFLTATFILQNSSNIFNGVTKFVKQSLWLPKASTKKIFYGKVPIISMFIFIPVAASFTYAIIKFSSYNWVTRLLSQDQIGIMLNNYFFESSINDLSELQQTCWEFMLSIGRNSDGIGSLGSYIASMETTPSPVEDQLFQLRI